MKILVTGATGHVGRPVAEQLLDLGTRVRALIRDPFTARLPVGAEPVVGDLARPGTLRAALEGAERLFLFPVPETAPDVVALARRAGVRRIVTLSSSDAGDAGGAAVAGTASADSGATEGVRATERVVEASGLEWTHVRAGELAAHRLAQWGPSIREERVVRHPDPEETSTPVHERDVADVAAIALLQEGHTGLAHTVEGPELLTVREQAQILARAVCRDIRVEKSPPPCSDDRRLTRLPWRGAGTAQPTAQAVTHQPARTFELWAREHARYFR